jgi:hypothetical protein
MVKIITHIGANVNVQLYEELIKKFPECNNSELVKRGLQALLKDETPNDPNFTSLTLTFTNNTFKEFQAKAKESNMELDDLTFQLLLDWINGS